jgi:hypothetical protein
VKRAFALTASAGAVAAFVLWAGTAAAGWENSPRSAKIERFAEPSGTVAFGDATLGTNITECPQAGETTEPEPVARIEKDEVWKLSDRGRDVRASTDYSCFPQNETTIDVNPRNGKSLVAGQNDYRNGFPFTGFTASSDGGRTWYDGIIPFPSTPAGPGNAGFVPSGGDPAVVFDRGGTAYMAQIAFWRHNDDNSITVARSTNGGFTWSRACIAINVGTPTDDQARCGGPGDPRQPGDGAVRYDPDNNNNADFSVTFNDKEYIGAGPRPAGVPPRCFAPETKTPIPPGSPGCPEEYIGPDRVYVTWTAFNNDSGVPFAITSSTIELSYSDDRGRSWSPKRTINGNAPFCTGAVRGPTFCDDNQFSVPTVSPHTGHLYVAFENFNTPDENQWLMVRSRDGGETFEGPFFVTPAFDVNLRGRPDCVARGSGSAALTNTCFRVPQTGAIQADKRGGAFADDLYLVMSDNRNGTRESTNTDVFFFKSLDGGSNWIGPTRVNDDPSGVPENRDCGRLRDPGPPPVSEPACPAGVHTGNDNWWPWLDINEKGDLNVTLKDRRLDTDSIAHEWPTSRQRPGNYLVWTWGANCEIDRSTLRECVAPGAAVIPQPTEPINPGPGPVPGSGPTFVDPFENFGISDVPSNYDYCFRAGIFCGDYESVAVEDGRAYTHFTDARNGRSSGGPAGGSSFPSQPGRNPACEQSDTFVDSWSASGKASGQNRPARSDALFLVTPCPGDADGDGDDDDDDDD